MTVPKGAKELMIENNKELAEFVESTQYKKSREIMKRRYELSLSTYQVARIAGLTHEDYIDLETGLVDEFDKYDKVMVELSKLSSKNE